MQAVEPALVAVVAFVAVVAVQDPVQPDLIVLLLQYQSETGLETLEP